MGIINISNNFRLPHNKQELILDKIKRASYQQM